MTTAAGERNSTGEGDERRQHPDAKVRTAKSNVESPAATTAASSVGDGSGSVPARILGCSITLYLIAALVAISPSSASAQPGATDEFERGTLDWSLWCPCQIDMKDAPIRFLPDPAQPGDGFISIIVDDASLGGNVCRSAKPDYECSPPFAKRNSMLHMSRLDDAAENAAPAAGSEDPDPLGPSFIRPPVDAPLKRRSPLMGAAPRNPYCSDDVLARVKAAGEEGECVQRQELRLQKRYRHSATEPYKYTIAFRMPENIEDRINSIRWVTAQWKQEPISSMYERQFGEGWGASPFLAQRFDNGVLHVTVQDEHCRCMVASAPDPNGSSAEWKDGKAQHCVSNKPGDPPGSACAADLELEYGPHPILTSPRGRWVEMSYRVEAGRSGRAVIEIYEDGRFIVRVTGKIGYEVDPDQHSAVKFKIGHYRDYMPYVHSMDVDFIRIVPVTD